MNINMKKLALVTASLIMAGGAMAQSTATGTGTSNATVIAPITITPVNTLEFGNVVAGAGTVTIAPAGGRTDSVAALSPGTQIGTVRAATFNVGGQGAFTYAITLPTAAVELKDSAATPNTMSVSAFTVASGGTGTVSGSVGTLAGGAGNLNVGATLNVASLQVPGAYTGTYTVTVAYN
uniref:DUF4402 domain-containing protein n=2 Tax=Polaromonas sp. E5S TaxID=1840267 RepID=A0A2S1FII2_9BURK|nr:hypothetical protein pE5SP1_p053 [Polaromonas sp. E5S]